MIASDQVELAFGFEERDRHSIIALLREYEASLGISLCFQNFEAELEGLPGDYAPPRGQMILARTSNGGLAGFVGVRPVQESSTVCEMKRLYVRPMARGLGLGRRLAEAIIAEAQRLGYRRMCLDTLPSMGTAQALYRLLEFRETVNYGACPHPGALYFERELDGAP